MKLRFIKKMPRVALGMALVAVLSCSTVYTSSFVSRADNIDDAKKQKEEAIEAFAEYAAENVPTAGNMRGSKEYRTLLVKVLTRRAWEAVGGMKNEY